MISLKNKLKALMLCAIGFLLALLLTVMAEASEIKGSEGLEYAYDESSNSYFVVGIGDCADTDIAIPSTYTTAEYGELPVTRIESKAFYNNQAIKSLSAGDNVNSIGEFAFHYCIGLEQVSLGKSTEVIEGSAFYFCTALETLDLSNVAVIGDYAFYNCIGLDTLVVPNTVNTIGEGTFKYCNNLIQLTLGKGLTKIGESAFEECYKLIEVYNLSQLDVKKAGEYVADEDGNIVILDGFAGYYAVSVHTSLDEESILIWGNNNFVFCYYNEKYYLVGETGTSTSLTLPNSINGSQYEIIRFAFYNRTALESIDLGKGVTKIGAGAFNFCGLTSIDIPSSVVEIAPMAFNECHLLESAYMTDSVKEIGYSAFQKCYTLTDIKLSNSITVINSSTFAGCKSLQYITLPKGITRIDRAAFGECRKLVKLIIPSTVTELGDAVFAYCEKLIKVIIPKGVSVVGANVFYDCGNATVYCGSAKETENWDSSWSSGAKSVVWSYEMALNDAIEFKGYSTNGKAICASYTIDTDVIEEYELSTGNNASIGFIYAKYDMLNGSNPLNESAEAIDLDSGRIINSSLSELFVSSYDIVLRNITEEYFDSDFVISLYTFDSYGVTYIQTESSANATGISYNAIIAAAEQDEAYDVDIELLEL